MTTNTYHALCDEVNLDKNPQCFYFDDCPYGFGHSCKDCDSPWGELRHPPQSAEQRERLEELIWSLTQCTYFNIYQRLNLCDDKGDYFWAAPNAYNINTDRDFVKKYWFKSRSEALYALTHKLVEEGVLSKEEVKGALNG